MENVSHRNTWKNQRPLVNKEGAAKGVALLLKTSSLHMNKLYNRPISRMCSSCVVHIRIQGSIHVIRLQVIAIECTRSGRNTRTVRFRKDCSREGPSPTSLFLFGGLSFEACSCISNHDVIGLR